MKQMFFHWPSLIYGIIFGFCLGLITVLLIGCSDDSIGPCYDHEMQCQILKSKMDNAKTESERNQYKQFYLAEKQLLDNCNK